MNKFNYFKILHLNCQSIISDSKKIQISNLINETNCYVLSLNETFLKKQHNLYFEGYVTLRSDRTEKKGGGTALCIKKSIIGTHIKIDSIPETVGYKIKLKNGNELALFSHYSSPSSELNEKLFEYAANNFKFFLKVGDFNALNTSWFCPTTNKKGNILLRIAEKLGLFILNNETPTYKRSKNILDLIICSKNMLENIEKFDVLSHSISDHCPIAATFKNITTDPKYFENINWQKFRETLRSKPAEKNSHLNAKDLDMAVQSLTNEIQEALKTATNRFQIKNVKNNVLTIPQHILKLIKFKRKVRRMFQNHYNPAHKKLFYYLKRTLKSELTKYKKKTLEENLKHLKNFRQSESKHWKALLNINREENPSQKDINIKADHHFTNDPAEIAELFACNLEKIFTENHPTTRNNSLLVPNLNKIHISRKEMINSIKTTNSRASAGLDLISNKVFSYNGHTSEDKLFNCGVPQGSCLSPTIFIMFFSDIAKIIPPDVKIALFADDLCIWVSKASKKDIQKILQNAVDKIIEYCKKWGVKSTKRRPAIQHLPKLDIERTMRKRTE
ncbi:RNA-directed DNA polymerase from mobile element jockey-like [Brachionus plicatilis]|uniref:RNA-directed DNA polymerase from mobile element jockey-like n=1 Tax=Brachionus plicatilis TaxID=10195 RepID=A0A3M7PMC0_BRAPC|nr:RNA-directed DNA polymerase from mobile element jockey-like [Brachionus plicatilis]